MPLHIPTPQSSQKNDRKPASRPRPRSIPTAPFQAAGTHFQPERPRERLLAHGPQILTDAELLAIILRTGTSGCDAIALGQKLVSQFGGLRGLLNASPQALLSIQGLGIAKTCEILAISELNRRALEEALAVGRTLDHPQRVKQYCVARLGHLTIEHCIALYLDNQLQLIAAEEVARGTLTQAPVYPREIVKAGLAHHAAAVILAHNHPSGTARASEADISLTRHLKQALAMVDIRLVDHLIVAGTTAVSLAEQGQC
ncbi:RadC family protein [Allopusillimonas ginsengisoli]|uniref:RadC family protein n=1 Tax=Allopusillimonas ginsengisoli TaxID=453575 RepID=UPI00101F08A6|nr:DNA repair protein RadC [Allopusillimonas ginsengisoli]TEA79517.1 JAB domain-containing protein [Allopusillimonas ginsengisoli]